MPKWIPYPISWLRMLVLMGITAIVGGSLRFFGTYGAIISYGFRNWGLFTSLTLIGFTIPFIAYAYLHSWILGKKRDGYSKNIPAPNSIKESLTSFVVLILSVVITVIITFPFFPNDATSNVKAFVELASAIWIIVILYLFQWHYLITNPIPKKQNVEEPNPQKKVDSIDRELMRLKHKTGFSYNEPPQEKK